MDIMIAIVIFIGTIFIFYSIFSSNIESKKKSLEDDAAVVLENIASQDSDIRVVDGVKINTTRLENLLGKNYSELKNKMRVENEFCIYFEDEEGNIIYLNQTQAGIGSGKINVSNVPCG